MYRCCTQRDNNAQSTNCHDILVCMYVELQLRVSNNFYLLYPAFVIRIALK